MTEPPLRILSLSVHGLVRGRDIELGRDADTGGQVLYVVDQAKALAAEPGVRDVILMTRQIQSKKHDDVYAQPEEPLGDGARIVRIPCGPRRYLRKESLWPYLDGFVDHAVNYIRTHRVLPDVVHAHYADAGYVGAQIAKLLGCRSCSRGTRSDASSDSGSSTRTPTPR
jgi:sucrose-phosphate synthase